MLKNTFKNTKRFSFVIPATGHEGKVILSAAA
jgi:hypothetical protein